MLNINHNSWEWNSMNSKDYHNSTLSAQERARLLLAELTLDEKMAQVSCVFPFNEYFGDEDYLRREMPYGIGEISTLEMRSAVTLEDAAAWQRRTQEIAMAQSPHRIPAIFHMEGLCGAFIQDSTSFPSGIARGAGWDPALEKEIAEVVSRQEAACGITHILAPVLDIARDPRMGRFGEAYGEDPVLAGQLGAAYTKGVQSTMTAGRQPESVAKHFVAFHNSEGGIHGAVSNTPPRLLEEVCAKSFQAAITKSKLKGIMPCYCTINGEPVHASKGLLSDLLRERMGFDGLVVSDYGGVGNTHSAQGLFETNADAGLACMEAGIDVETPNPTGFIDELKARFRSGEADMAILDRAVRRVLEAKFRMGLFEHPFALQGEALRRAVVQESDREISLRSARESMVLLKNNSTLPLKKGIRKLAVIGPHADFARKFFGGYTMLCMKESTYAIANSIAGVSGCIQDPDRKIVTVPGTNIQSDETEEFDPILKRQKPSCRSLVEELRIRMPETEILYAYGYPVAGADESRFGEALALAGQADAVILTLGGKHGTCSMATMGEGVDGTNINLPACQDAFIRKAAALGKPLIGVHFDGRPISSDTADEYLDAILEAWNPAECGSQAVADVLLGDYNPGGKLPVCVARNAGQIPIYYNHPANSSWDQSGSIGFADYVDLPHTPRYYFGYGLSYTSFDYADLRISRNEILPNETAEICFTVKNTGECAGDEIVQLYLHDRYARMVRPVKELIGFCRVHLLPGEEKTVCFTVDGRQMAYLDSEMHWFAEKGMIDVEIGASSEDIRLRGSYTVIDSAFAQAKDRPLWAECCVEGQG